MGRPLASTLAHYVPMDRRQALSHGVPLASKPFGTTVFADISGFTALTDSLVHSLGTYRGAEELISNLNRVYSALIGEVDRYHGSVISFAGDGVIAWFAGNAAEDAGESVLRASACCLAMQKAMTAFHTLWISGAKTVSIGLKAAIATGQVHRLLVGDPDTQVFEVLAGEPLSRVSCAVQSAADGEVLLDSSAAAVVHEQVVMTEKDEQFNRLNKLLVEVKPIPWTTQANCEFSAEQVRPWVLRPVAQRLALGQAALLAELRHTVSVFLRFQELDYDADDQAGTKLDAFVRWVQKTVERYAGSLLSVTTGDKGHYVYFSFGAPFAHGDDAARAVAASLALLFPPVELSFIGKPQIGIAAGQSRVGNVGDETRTYAVMGEGTNLAARLMAAAAPGQILMSAAQAPSVNRRFLVRPVRPITLKGKSEPAPVVAVLGSKPHLAARSEEPEASFSFIGRESELESINETLNEVLSGNGRMIGVSAEAGMGKSRFAIEVVQRATAAGFDCLIGEAQSTETQTAYLGWRRIWRTFFGVDSRTRPEDRLRLLERELSDIDPELLPRLPLLAAPLGLGLADNSTTTALDPRSRKESLYDMLIQCLRLRAARAPLLVLFEDAHWFDPLSSELAKAVSQVLADIPVLLLFTYRPADTPHAISRTLCHDTCWHEFRLNEFSVQESSLLIRERLQLTFGPHIPLATEFVDWLNVRAGGNPFYIEELINYLQFRGISPASLKAFEHLELPSSLSTLILSRIDALSPEQQTVLKVASVLGRTFQRDWLRAAWPAIGLEEQINQNLDILVNLDLTPLNTENPQSYVFKHATIQEVAYQSLPFALREEIHHEFAQWLEQHGAESSSLDLLAYHYGKSRNRAKQREYFAKAAEAAASRFANSAAIEYYERLLELLDPVGQAPVLIVLADILTLTGSWKPAEAHFLRAIELATRHQDCMSLARARLGFARLQRSQGDYGASALSLDKARQEFVELRDFTGTFDSSMELAQVNVYRNHIQEAQELVEISLASAERRGDRGRVARALHLMGNIQTSRQDFAEASRWWRQSLAQQEQLNNLRGAAELKCNLAFAALLDGRLTEAEGLVRQGIDLFNNVGARSESCHARITLSLVLMDKDDLLGARAMQIANLAVLSELGALRLVGESFTTLALISCRGGANTGTFRYALHLVGAARTLNTRGGYSIVLLRNRVDQMVEAGCQYLGKDQAEAAIAFGESMAWREAVKYAIRFDGNALPESQ